MLKSVSYNPAAMSRLADLPANPMEFFAVWYQEARDTDSIRYPHAMSLATIDENGMPDARMVLLLHLEDNALVFFTDEGSVKGRQLVQRPDVALVFYWGELDRQVRVRGRVQPGSDELSDRCFTERPRRSRLTAWASRQSLPCTGRDELEARYAEVEERFEGQEEIQRPESWRAYRTVPRSFEFWQGRSARLHDRFLYVRGNGGWQRQRLEP